jgi:hypothetical protein
LPLKVLKGTERWKYVKSVAINQNVTEELKDKLLYIFCLQYTTHTHTHERAPIYVCMYVCIYIFVCVCVCVRARVCVWLKFGAGDLQILLLYVGEFCDSRRKDTELLCGSKLG